MESRPRSLICSRSESPVERGRVPDGDPSAKFPWLRPKFIAPRLRGRRKTGKAFSAAAPRPAPFVLSWSWY